MRRPPSAVGRAMPSMARAMFCSACETAGITFLSASLMMRAICSGARVSSISLARLRCSVESARRSTVGLLAGIGHDLAFFVGADQMHAVRRDDVVDDENSLILGALIEVMDDAFARV